ncbi:MAG: hypothetical protein U0800_26150 [Isosphaeraceae bacterium]
MATRVMASRSWTARCEIRKAGASTSSSASTAGPVAIGTDQHVYGPAFALYAASRASHATATRPP